MIVPFYDERDNLERIPDELKPAIDQLGLSWELVLVDDGSRDDSLAVARRVAAELTAATVVPHGRNRGLGAALRTGFETARGELWLTLDSDLTFHPRDAAKLLDRFRQGDVDVVLGSPALAGYDADIAWYRVVLSKGANLLYQLALGRRLTAVTPIFRLYRAASMRPLTLGCDGFDINAEVLAKLLLGGARVAEVPVTLHQREHGVSKLRNTAEIVNHLRMLARIVRWRLGGR